MHRTQRHLSVQPLETRKLMAADAGDEIHDTGGNDLPFDAADVVAYTITSADVGGGPHDKDGTANVAMMGEIVDGNRATDAVFRSLGRRNEPATSAAYIADGIFVSGTEFPPSSGSP